MPTSSMNGEDAILFSVMDRAARIYSYSWLIEWTTSSLCIKPTYKPLQLMKVSIHGADPKHIDKQHFRLDFDHEQPATKAVNAGGAWTEDGAELPQYFDGQQVTKRAKHIVRLRSMPRCSLREFRPRLSRRSKRRRRFTPRYRHRHPKSYPSGSVSQHCPPILAKEKKVKAHDAGMGPIANFAGLYLTAVNY
jgi:hypothetical protein